MANGQNVTIANLSATGNFTASSSLPFWDPASQGTFQVFATQVAAYVYSTSVALTNQTTATSTATGSVSFFASSPGAFVIISVNGTSYKLPLYNP